MKKLFVLMFVLLVSVKLAAQSDKVFHTYIYNDEFKVYMDINLALPILSVDERHGY